MDRNADRITDRIKKKKEENMKIWNSGSKIQNEAEWTTLEWLGWAERFISFLTLPSYDNSK